MSLLKNVSVSKVRPLPVLILADTSGSMQGAGKIGALNQALREMIASFAQEDGSRAEIHAGIITFGGKASMHAPLQPARQLRWKDMSAAGGTPMGAALDMAAGLLEDKAQIPSNAFRPALVLLSDGFPTDDYQGALRRVTQEGRAAKADRMAMAIGDDADEAMLRTFIGRAEQPLFRAQDAAHIQEFFQMVTMTMTARSRSLNPNVVPRSLYSPFSNSF